MFCMQHPGINETLGLLIEHENMWFHHCTMSNEYWGIILFFLITSLILAAWHLLLDEVHADGVCIVTESLVHFDNKSCGGFFSKS